MIKVHQQSTFFHKSSLPFLLARQLPSDILSYFNKKKLEVFNVFQTDWLLVKLQETLN